MYETFDFTGLDLAVSHARPENKRPKISHMAYS